MFDPRLDALLKKTSGYWTQRIAAELEYAHELSLRKEGAYDAAISVALDLLVTREKAQAALTPQDVAEAERRLAPAAAEAKRYSLLCAAHAHIDMNWMWRWDETVAVTLDTFRTMLDLMDEYPQFKFSQSQASVYQLVETYDPEMLAAIRQRVREGRWEVTAATWVEADKNMTSGESMARHLLYTRRYLQDLFGLKPDDFRMDFEPDTFGHSKHVPEMLADGGVRYYYHCRGDQSALLYRWQAPSGRSIVVYREPQWYLGYVEPDVARYLPAFCSQYGLDTMLKVYGVGDHGGGPTRRDLERLLDMDTWPVYPNIRFGTFKDFFAQVEKIVDRLPVQEEELNFIFTGCYTSQSRIKRANRLAENALFEAEAFSALAAVGQGSRYPKEQFARAWQNTLFNQFHDILPGSGTVDTREYALGLFQQTLAITGSTKQRAMRRLAGMDGTTPHEPAMDAISEGAGVGFGVEGFRTSQVSRGQGMRRLFHVFNPAAWERSGLAEITLWDWAGSLERMQWQDAAGGPVPHQLVDAKWQDYWGHRYLCLLVKARVPACGYTTLVLDESRAALALPELPVDMRVERPEEMCLENEHLLALFDPITCQLVRLVDKRSGESLVTAERPAGLRYILEDDRLGMTAWTLGRFMQVRPLAENVRLLRLERGALRQELVYEVSLGSSRIKAAVRLEAGRAQLDYVLECDWQEIGRKGQGVPQLSFQLPLAHASAAYRYDVPLGVTQRPVLALDVPALSWGFAVREGEGEASVQLISRLGYGMRGEADALSLSLLRSSYDPDPYPEVGMHPIEFTLAVTGARASNSQLAQTAFACQHPFSVLSGAGSQPVEAGYLSLEGGSALVAGIKLPEDDADGGSLLVRTYEVDGRDTQVQLRFEPPVRQARLVDVHEQPLADAPEVRIEEQEVRFPLGACRVGTVRVEF